MDWKDYLKKAVAAGDLYDGILFLGNSLAYQDSWPDRAIPPICRGSDSVISTIQECRKIIQEDGMLLLETYLESEVGDSQPTAYTRYYHRSAPFKLSNQRECGSVWNVEIDPATGTRIVDTFLMSGNNGQPVDGHIRFSGHLLTPSLMATLAREARFTYDLDASWSRRAFSLIKLYPDSN